MPFTPKKKSERTTRELLQLGWDVGEIGFSSSVSNSFGLTNKAKQKFLTSKSKQNRAAVPGGTIFKYPRSGQVLCMNHGIINTAVLEIIVQMKRA